MDINERIEQNNKDATLLNEKMQLLQKMSVKLLADDDAYTDQEVDAVTNEVKDICERMADTTILIALELEKNGRYMEANQYRAQAKNVLKLIDED